MVYHERAKETAPTLRIERIDRPQPRPVSAAEVSMALAKAGQTVQGYAELVRAWWQENLAARPNQLRFSRATYLSNGGVPDRHFAFGAWRKSASQPARVASHCHALPSRTPVDSEPALVLHRRTHAGALAPRN